MARRSPAMTTPSAKRTATHVVACGTAPSAPASPGTGAGAVPRRRSSSGKLEPGSSPARKMGIAHLRRGLLPTLLDVGLDEVLGVGLEHVVDLVEQVVELGLQLLAGLGRGWRGRIGVDGLVRSVPPALASGFVRPWPLPSFLRADAAPRRLRTQAIEELGSAVALVDQPSHVLGGSAQWLHHRHAAQRFASGVEHHRVPVRRDHRSRRYLARQRPRKYARVRRRRIGDGGDRRRLRRRSSRARHGGRGRVPGAGRGTAGRSPSAWRRRAAARGARRSRRRGGAWPPSRPTGRPSRGRARAPSSTCSQRSSTSQPDRLVDAGETVVLLVLDGRLEQAPLDLERGRPPSVGEQHRGRQRRVVADVADRRDGVAEQPVVAERVVLDHRQDDLRRADLEVRGDLAQVGVADDDVQPAVLLGVASAARRAC